ncbi:MULTISPECIES: hypothetical protein [unclassified Micromonospora]|uniref:hypothetical protein n=1 Tax=unclassified Micromonospora TaxID=2617518 RepID=UPI00098D37C4|nr:MULTISPECIES: hypothetical protein [unclassified Micromonospora]MDI5937579.1 hypothetical protein [Micromonospora sp. DH15]OON32670.1 hypothetical protein BSA16_04310 [Micromonospora sp. Rc5]
MFKSTISRTRAALLALAATAALLAAGSVLAAPASAASRAAAPADGRPVCVTVLAPLKAGQEFSEVLSRRCGASEQAALAATREAGVTASVQIFTLIEHANYGGAYDHVYGGAWCDAAGYGINPGWYEWRLSSFLPDGGCYYTTLTNHSGASRRFNGGTPSLPSGFNDNAAKIRTTA